MLQLQKQSYLRLVCGSCAGEIVANQCSEDIVTVGTTETEMLECSVPVAIKKEKTVQHR